MTIGGGARVAGESGDAMQNRGICDVERRCRGCVEPCTANTRRLVNSEGAGALRRGLVSLATGNDARKIKMKADRDK